MNLLVGAGMVDKNALPALPSGVTPASWEMLFTLENTLPKFKGIMEHVSTNVEDWEPLYQLELPHRHV